jgi:hypothetical protein
MTPNPDIDLIRRAQAIVRKLEAQTRDGTVSREAAKQLRTLVRTAERNFALGHEEAARKMLDWAS